MNKDGVDVTQFGTGGNLISGLATDSSANWNIYSPTIATASGTPNIAWQNTSSGSTYSSASSVLT